MKKLLSVVLTLSMILALAVAFASFSFADTPEGTAIRTVDDFLAMEKDGTYYLENDIDFENVTYNGRIYQNDFRGTLDGNGHSLLNIKIETDADAGVFGERFGGTLKNITFGSETAPAKVTSTGGGKAVAVVAITCSEDSTFENVTVWADLFCDKDSKVGAFAGWIASGKTLNFTDCTVNGNVTGGPAAGYVVTNRSDAVNLNFTNCVNNANVSTGDAAGRPTAGFFTIHWAGTTENVFNIAVKNCVNNGTISAYKDGNGGTAAGFICPDREMRVNCTIENSINNGIIDGGKGSAGGLFSVRVDSNNAGHPITLTVKNSVNTGAVSAADWRAGGIVGIFGMNSASKLTLDHCYNTGSVTNNGGGGNACGIVGELSQMGCDADATRIITNCYNIGALTTNTSEICRVGGGDQAAQTVSNCFYTVEGARAVEGGCTTNNVTFVADAVALLTALQACEPENAEVTFVADSENINGGYPVLSWQVVKESAPETEAPEIPEEPLLLKTDKTEYAVGESVKVTAIGSGKDWVGIYYVGDPHSIRWVYVETVGSGVEFDVWADTEDNGSSPATLEEGRYIIRLMPDDTSDLDKALAEIEITVGDPADTPVIGDASRFSIEKTEFTVGEAIKVTAVGSGTDWVGIYRMNEQDSMRWVYVETVGSGVEFDVWTQTQDNGSSPATLGEGTYIIRLMPNDQTDHGLAIASVIITVTKPEAPEIPEAPAFSEGAITETADGEYTIASDGFSAFISTRRNATNAAHNDIRVILATDIEGLDAYMGLNLTLTFKKDSAVVKTATWDVVKDLKFYASASAAGNTYTAADGCALFGIVITGVPNADWDEVTATVTDNTGKGVGEGSAKADGLVVPAPVDIKGELDSLVIEDHHASLDKWPSLVFSIGNTTLWQTLRGDKANYPDDDHWSNPAYKWVLTVNGEEIVPEKFSIYDGDAWGYFRAAIAPKDALDYVDNTATLDITLNIYDNTTDYLVYFADLDPLTYDRPVIPVHDPIHIDSVEGVEAHLWGTPFETPGGLGNKAALIYRVTGIFETINGYITDEVAYAKVTLNGTVYTIKNYENGGDIFRFDVQSEGAVIYSGLTYKVKVEFFNVNDQLLYYSNEYTCVSTMTSSNAPTRTPMNVTLPDGLTKLTVDSTKLSTENINHWGDGPVANLFDGKTGVGGSNGSKIGGNKGAGDPTVYFSLTEAATISYFTFTTGGDTGTYTGRNPYGFTLYGKVGSEWVILADIRDNETNVTGFTPANSTPYSYAITNPQSCVEYKVVLYTGGDFQLNELELYAG